MEKWRKLILVLVLIAAIAIPIFASSTPAYALVNDRFWIGGTGNWNDTAHWSLASGGAGGASAPNSTNDVNFDANSDTGAGFTVTINVAATCRSWYSDTVDQVMTLAGSQTLGLYGDLLFKADHVRTYTGTLTFAGTGGGNTIDTNGVTLATVAFNGVGGDWTLLDSLTASVGANLTFTNGTVNLNGQAVSCVGVSIGAGATVNCGASTWTVSAGWVNAAASWDAGTSTIIFTGADANMNANSKTYYDVEFTGSGNSIVQGANIFHNLTRTATTDSDKITFYDNQTIDTFTLDGIDEANRVECRSSTASQRTLTVATVVAEYASFYYIKGAGAGDWDLAPGTGGSCDMGGNSDITFNETIYWIGGGGATLSTGWGRTSGGTKNADWGSALLVATAGKNKTCVFDANSVGGAVNANATRYMGYFDASALTSDLTLTLTSTGEIDIYYDYIGNSHIKFDTGTYYFTLEFNGSYSHDFNPNGGTFAGRIRLYDAQTGCIINLLDDYQAGNTYSEWRSNFGSIITNDNDITLGSILLLGSWATDTDLGASTITCSSFSSSVIIDAGTSEIICESFTGANFTYYDVTITATATSSITGTNTFHNLTIQATNITNAQCTFAADQLVTNDLVWTGYNASTRRLKILSSVPGTQRTIYVNHGYGIQWSDIQDIVAAGTTAPWDISAGLNSDMGNNLYITFTSVMNVYWIGNTGSWSDATHWANTSGGAGGTGRVPLVNDNAIFDANSVTLPLQTITMNIVNVPSITATAVANNPTLSGTTIDVYGSLSLGNLTLSVTTVNFKGQNNATLSSQNTITSALVVNKSVATMAYVGLQSHVTCSTSVTLLSGTLKLNVFTLTSASFISSDTTSARALDMDTGIFVVTATGTKWNVVATNMTVVDSPDSTIVFQNNTATACTFTGGSKAYGNFTIQGTGNYSTTISGTNSFNVITIDRSDAAKTLTGSVTCTILGLNIPLSGATMVTITNTDFTMTSGEVYGDYLTISGSAAAGGATFWANAGGHSVNSGGNSGWIWTLPDPPTVVTLDPSNVSYLGEQLNGQITDTGDYGTFYCYFEYGPTVGYGFDTSPETVLTGLGLFNNYLSPYKVYHYRAAVRYGLDFIEYGADKVVSLTGAVGQAVADITALPELTEGTPLIDSAPSQPGNMYTEGNTAGIPVAPLVDPALAESGTPVAAFWYPLAFAVAIGLGFLAYGFTRTILVQAIVSACVMAGFCGGGALGDGLLPYFTVLVFVIEGFMIFLIQEKQHV